MLSLRISQLHLYRFTEAVHVLFIQFSFQNEYWLLNV